MGKLKKFFELNFYVFFSNRFENLIVISFKSHKNWYFSEKQITKIIQRRHEVFALTPEPRFFPNTWGCKYIKLLTRKTSK